MSRTATALHCTARRTRLHAGRCADDDLVVRPPKLATYEVGLRMRIFIDLVGSGIWDRVYARHLIRTNRDPSFQHKYREAHLGSLRMRMPQPR